MAEKTKEQNKLQHYFMYFLDRFLALFPFILAKVGLLYGGFKLWRWKRRISKYRGQLDRLWSLLPRVKPAAYEGERLKLRAIEINLSKEESAFGEKERELNQAHFEFRKLRNEIFRLPSNY
ncbi:MAG TPA: hypothetical protein ENH97_01245 [bacterium]|nr:hypothetical protein [bacterium]